MLRLPRHRHARQQLEEARRQRRISERLRDQAAIIVADIEALHRENNFAAEIVKNLSNNHRSLHAQPDPC